MDDAPAEIQIGGSRFPGQIISVQGSEIAVGIEYDCGKSIAQARLITNLCYLLEVLRKRYEEVLNGQRELDTRLPQKLFGLSAVSVRNFEADLNLLPSSQILNTEQVASIRKSCGSEIHFIWGPPGTGKSQTIGFLIASLIRQSLRVLVAFKRDALTG